MRQLYDELKKCGLTETEVILYVEGLKYASIGVSELVKQTRIKRTTVYHALDTLMQKGIVAKKGTGSRLVFSMIAPEHLEKLLDEKIALIGKQKELLKKCVPLLAARDQKTTTETQVSHFEGTEGVKMVVEEALYAKTRRWDIISPPRNFFSEFNRAYAQYFLETRRARDIIARSLWESTENRRMLTAEELKQRQPRMLPPAMHGKFKSVIIVFDNKVAIISSLKELTAVLIQSNEIHDTMEALFEGLWSVASPYPQT